MTRILLATTALAAALATGAYAQDTTAPAPAAPAAPMTQDAAPAQPVVKADGFLASNIIGETVYNGTGDDAENIGSVNDIVLDAEGKAESVVIGVGGFLGIGEKNVAVDYAELDWAERDGDRWIVAPMTREQIEALPAFDAMPYEPTPVAATDPAATAMPPADSTAQAPATTDPAAPPADTTAEAPAAATDPAVTTDGQQTAAIDRSTLTEVPAAEIGATELVGTTVYGADDANVGEIGEVVLGANNTVDAYIIDVGGFLGVGEKPVAVGGENLVFMTDADGNRYLYTSFTKEQLDAQPTYDASTYAEQRDTQRLIITQ